MDTGSPPQIGTLAGAATRSQAVANELRARIISGELPPGTRLKQGEIAALLGVSTTPVREAFTKLARQGLVRQDAHRGVIVFSPSVDDVSENWDLRIALESLAVEIAAKELTAEELDELDRILAELDDALAHDPQRFLTVLNPLFHKTIYAASKRPKLLELIDGLRDASIAYQSLIADQGLTTTYIEHVNEQHREILEALRARAPKKAAKVLKTHLEDTRDRIVRLIGEATSQEA